MQSVITKREVPKDLQGVSGLGTGFDPPDVQHTRLVITGQPGAGKSTLMNGNPKLLMLDPERGGATVADPEALRFTPPPTVQPDQLDKAYLEFVDKIVARKLSGKSDILMIGIDTIDEMISLFQKALCLRENVTDVGDIGGGHGKGYFMVRDSIFGMLDKAYRAGLGWVLIAHTKVRHVTIDGKERETCGLGISDSYKTAVFQKCEHMMFVEKGIVTVVGPATIKTVNGKKLEKPGKRENKKVRKLKTSPGGLWMGGETTDVKVRVPLPEEMVLPELGGWDMFVSAYNDAVASLQGEKK